MIETNTPDPDALENIFDNATADAVASASADRRAILQAENEIAKKYWGSFQPRIVLTFLAFAIGWSVVLYLGLTGAISLWVGLVLNTFLQRPSICQCMKPCIKTSGAKKPARVGVKTSSAKCAQFPC